MLHFAILFLHEMNPPGGIRWDKKKNKSYLCLCFQVTAITTSAEFCEQQITYSCRMSRLLNTPGKGWGFACLFTTDSNTSTQHWHRQDVLFVTSSGIWREIHVNHSTLSKFPFCLGTLQTNEKGVYGHEKPGKRFGMYISISRSGKVYRKRFSEKFFFRKVMEMSSVYVVI